jgi:hypothetical protein
MPLYELLCPRELSFSVEIWAQRRRREVSWIFHNHFTSPGLLSSHMFCMKKNSTSTLMSL